MYWINPTPRQTLLWNMAKALHKQEGREGWDGLPKFSSLPEFALVAYLDRADKALRVVERKFHLRLKR